jgi:hypothetical protein
MHCFADDTIISFFDSLYHKRNMRCVIKMR